MCSITGEGLLESARDGCPAHAAMHAAGLGVRWPFSCLSLAAGAFIDPDDLHACSLAWKKSDAARMSEGPCSRHATLIAQLTAQATDTLSLGFLAQHCTRKGSRQGVT
jgi:hypothetical protein